MSGAENSAAITALPGKRLAYLDNAKGAGMLMIMIGHRGRHTISVDRHSELMYGNRG